MHTYICVCCTDICLDTNSHLASYALLTLNILSFGIYTRCADRQACLVKTLLYVYMRECVQLVSSVILAFIVTQGCAFTHTHIHTHYGGGYKSTKFPQKREISYSFPNRSLFFT